MSARIDYITLITRELAGYTDQEAIDGVPLHPERQVNTTVGELRVAICNRVEPMLEALRTARVTQAGRDLIRNRIEELTRMIDSAEDRLDRMYQARRAPEQIRVNEVKRHIEDLQDQRRALQ